MAAMSDAPRLGPAELHSEEEADDVELLEAASEPISASQPSPPWYTRLLGLGLIAASAVVFSIMSLLVNIAAHSFPTFQITLVRFGVQTAISGVFALRALGWNLSSWVPRHQRIFMASRAGFGTFAMVCAFWALTHLPLSEATVIVFTSSVWTAAAAGLLLKEPFGPPQVAAAAISLGGVIMVARPAFLFGSAAGEDGANPAAAAGAGASLGGASFTASRPFALVTGCLSALTAAGAYLSIRKLGGVNTMAVVFFYGIVGVLASVVMLFSLQAWAPLGSVADGALLLGIGVLGALGQWLMNAGFQRENAGIGSLMRNVDIVCAFVWQVTILQEPVSAWSLGGAAAVLVGTATIAVLKARAKPDEARGSLPPSTSACEREPQGDIEMARLVAPSPDHATPPASRK